MDPTVRAQFASPDPEVRRSAIADLQGRADGSSVAFLVAALGDADWRVRKEAIRVTASFADRAAVIPALVAALGTPENVGLRNAAVEALTIVGTPAVAPLLGALPAMGADTRRFAIEALGEIGDPAATSALVEALADQEPNVRYAAGEALGRIGGEAAAQALLSVLTVSDDLLRLAALDGLNRMGAPVPISVVAPLAERKALRGAALTALGRCPSGEAVSILSSALKDRSPSTARAAATALGRLIGSSDDGAGEATSRLRALSSDEVSLLSDLARSGTEEERIAAVRLLGAAQHPEGLAALVEAAGDDSIVREVERALLVWGPAVLDALLVLLDRTSSRAAASLIPLLPALATGRDPTPIQRRLRTLLSTDEDGLAAAAADAVGRLQATGEIDGLMTALRRGGPRTIRASCRALLAIATRDRAAVRRAVAGTPLEGRGAEAVCEVLAAVAVPEDGATFRAALASEDARVRRAAIDALATLGGPDAAEAIPFALADEAPEVQATAARALGRIGGPRASDALLAALSATDARVRAAAARALADAKEPRAVPLLRERVRSEDGLVALAALEALAVLGDASLGSLLVEALGHADAEVVKQALRSIGALREPRAATRIALCLDHPSWDVRSTAATLLGALRDPESQAALTARLATEEDSLVTSAIAEALGRLEPGNQRHG